MKRLLLITLLIGYIYPCVAQDKPIRTEESLEGTVIYKKTTTFEVDGYTYQCDVDDGSQFVTLYNKENKLTYKDIVYKATGKIYIGSWNEKKVIEYNSSMSKQADFIVDEAFTKAMADELGKREFTITMLLSPDTGKVNRDLVRGILSGQLQEGLLNGGPCLRHSGLSPPVLPLLPSLSLPACAVQHHAPHLP